MTVTLDLPPELEGRLKAEADRLGVPLPECVLRLLEPRLSEPVGAASQRGDRESSAGGPGRKSLPRVPTARELLAMPLAERNRVLAAQAVDAERLYAEDLSLPVADRELTAFTALDGEPPAR